MIFEYSYQEKLLKNKEVVNFLKENPKAKQIKVSLSITKMCFLNLKKFILQTLKYFYELFTNFNFFFETFKKRNTEKNNKCILLGNGPSLNKIKVKDLQKFQKNGNKIFATNFWFANKKYSQIIPNYLIISDVKLFKSRKYFKSNSLYKKKINLHEYINKHSEINLILPPNCVKYAKVLFKNNIYTFSDSEFDFLYSFSNPFIPRGYSSISIINGLSLAKWLNFKKIFLLGIDNTYLRHLFSNKNNDILFLETHSYNDSLICDYTNRYNSIFDYIYDHIKVFKSYETLAKSKNIFNLDENSLTSFFIKKEISYLNK